MTGLFIGKPLHWLLLGLIILASCLLGYFHVHVSYFNYFVFAMLGLGALSVFLILSTHAHGDQDTREPLEDLELER